MSSYAKIRTSAEVWAVIHARHRGELKVFLTETHQGHVRTAYGLDGSDWPLIEALTTWEVDATDPSRRNNQRREHWLCVPVSES